MPPGVVIPIESTTQGQTAILERAKERLQTLGSKISAIVQQYNGLKRELMALPEHPTKAQILDLLERRRAAVEALLSQHRSRLDVLRAATGETAQPASFQGLGEGDDLSTLDTQLTEQQVKLTALSTYFDAYKAALSAGTQPPALPAELSEGTFGFSPMWLAGLVALAAGAYFLWFREK